MRVDAAEWAMPRQRLVVRWTAFSCLVCSLVPVGGDTEGLQARLQSSVASKMLERMVCCLIALHFMVDV
eukprot:SAG31_NODE_70_length_28117_cov_100.521843_25_plen_69_part_00